jgi:hypothetical protein
MFFNSKSSAIYTNHGNLQEIFVSMNCKDLPQRHVDSARLPTYNDFQIGNGKAIPLQALTGPEGSRRFRLPDFKTIGT